MRLASTSFGQCPELYPRRVLSRIFGPGPNETGEEHDEALGDLFDYLYRQGGKFVQRKLFIHHAHDLEVAPGWFATENKHEEKCFG